MGVEYFITNLQAQRNVTIGYVQQVMLLFDQRAWSHLESTGNSHLWHIFLCQQVSQFELTALSMNYVLHLD